MANPIGFRSQRRRPADCQERRKSRGNSALFFLFLKLFAEIWRVAIRAVANLLSRTPELRFSSGSPRGVIDPRERERMTPFPRQ